MTLPAFIAIASTFFVGGIAGALFYHRILDYVYADFLEYIKTNPNDLK